MADGYQKGMGGGGGVGGGGGREGGEFLYIRCTGVMSFCRSAYFIIFLTAVVQRPKTLPSGPKPYKRGLMILLTPFVFRCVFFADKGSWKSQYQSWMNETKVFEEWHF